MDGLPPPLTSPILPMVSQHAQLFTVGDGCDRPLLIFRGIRRRVEKSCVARVRPETQGGPGLGALTPGRSGALIGLWRSDP